MKKTALLLLSLCIISCNKYDKNGRLIKDYDELERAKWLLGNWQKKDSLGVLSENWIQENDSTFVGHCYFIINKNDTVHQEHIELEEDKKHLVFSTIIKGEDFNESIQYQLTNEEDSILIFENPKHLYPKKIVYKLDNKAKLQVAIFGQVKEKNKKNIYLLQKTKDSL